MGPVENAALHACGSEVSRAACTMRGELLPRARSAWAAPLGWGAVCCVELRRVDGFLGFFHLYSGLGCLKLGSELEFYQGRPSRVRPWDSG
jgi:hypothetical protein